MSAEAAETVWVHYATTLPSTEAMTALADDWLTPEERTRFERFIPDEARINFLAARILLRRVIGERLDRDPQGIEFRAEEGGKLALAGPTESAAVQFNLAHTRGCVAAVVTDRGAVGVDVERLDPLKATPSVARLSFSDAEQRGLASLSGPAYVRDFFRLWTLKEAYLKARGYGLALPLGDFSFALPSAVRPGVAFSANPERDDAPERWRFGQMEIDENWVLATCVERGADGPVQAVFRETNI